MRFFIHVFNGSQVISDPEGGEFPDLDAAVAEAAQGAREIIVDHLRQGKPVPARWEVHLADEDGAVLEVLPLAALVATYDDFTTPESLEAPEAARKDAGFAAAYATAKATAERSRSPNDEIQATVMDIRAQLRMLSAFKFS
jgi:hypothetical protein